MKNVPMNGAVCRTCAFLGRIVALSTVGANAQSSILK
jgi:hypothetical protein